ncbi:LytR/AlgR family response regulator transcription factor [Spirosoma koreense]
MFSLFNQPYPASNDLKRQLRKAAVIGLFVGLFLLLFQPFGINLWQTDYKSLKVLGFGGVSFVVTILCFIVWPRLFPRRFSEEQWTVGREIMLITANVLLIAIANRFYLESLLAPGEDSGLSWVGMILVTFLLGLFPVTGLVVLNYINQLKKYSRTAADLPVHAAQPSSIRTEDEKSSPADPLPGSSLELVADNEKDKLSLHTNDLLFIESSDNYSTVVYLKNGQAVKPLLRSSLSRLEKQIDRPRIVRCHRSYIVNLDRVERVTGNAQGYKLHLAGGPFQIPVARQYNETLIAGLRTV